LILTAQVNGRGIQIPQQKLLFSLKTDDVGGYPWIAISIFCKYKWMVSWVFSGSMEHGRYNYYNETGKECDWPDLK
jgi:hypothetical protein